MSRAVVVAAVIAASVASCGKASKDAPVIGQRQKLEYPVDVAPLVQRSMTFAVNAAGSIDAYQVQVTARVAGPVDEVKFMEGDEVNKDQPLVTINRARYAIALEQARAAYAKAVATEKSAEAALDRRLDAQKESPGLVAGEEIEQKQTAVDTAKADIESAKQAQAVAELESQANRSCSRRRRARCRRARCSRASTCRPATCSARSSSASRCCSASTCRIPTRRACAT